MTASLSVLVNLPNSLSLASAENCPPPSSLLPADLDKDLDKDLVPFMVRLSSNLQGKSKTRTHFFFLLLSLIRRQITLKPRRRLQLALKTLLSLSPQNFTRLNLFCMKQYFAWLFRYHRLLEPTLHLAGTWQPWQMWPTMRRTTQHAVFQGRMPGKCWGK